MDLSNEGILRVTYSVIILIFMMFIDYFLGGMLIEFANSADAEISIILGLMITFVLAFGTFVVPLLILTRRFVNPFNIMLGVGSLLVGIPLVMVIYQVVILVLNTVLPENLKVIGWLFVLILIIVVGFIAPLFIMLKEDTMLAGIIASE